MIRLRLILHLPIISIVDTTCEAVLKIGAKKVGLLGTQFTMQNGFYSKVFQDKGIEIQMPTNAEQDYIHRKYIAELENGIFVDETKSELLKIIKRMKDMNSIEAVVLGCTELPLILTEDHFEMKFLNTTKIHVDSIVRYCNE